MFKVRSIFIVILIKHPLGWEWKDDLEAVTVLVSPLRVLGAVGVGGVHGVEVDRVVRVAPGPLTVIVELTDNERLTVADVDGPGDLVLEGAEVSNKRV